MTARRILSLSLVLCFCSGIISAQQIIDNGDPADRLFKIDYSTFPGDHVVRLTNDAALGFARIEASGPPAFSSITFTNPTSSLTIQLGDGTNTFYLDFLDETFTTTMIILGEGGEDTFNIQGITKFVNSTIVQGGDGNDVFNIGSAGSDLAAIQSTLQLDGNANASSPQSTITIKGVAKSLAVGDTLNFLDTSFADGGVYVLNGNNLQRTGTPNINFTTMETLLLDTGDITNNITVNNNLANKNITIDAGGQPDIIFLQNTGNFGNTTVLGKNHVDTITANSTGIGEFLYIEGNQNGDTITLGTVPVNGRTKVDAGSQADTINVRASAAFTVVDILGGNNNDTINIGSDSNTLNTVLGTVCVNGEAHDGATVTLNIEGAGNTLFIGDKLNILNQGDFNFSLYSMSASNITETGSATIEYEEIETIGINLGAGTNSITISDTPDSVNLTLQGGDEIDFVAAAALGASANVIVNAAGGEDIVNLTTTGDAFVQINGGNGRDEIGLNNNLVGGRVEFNGGNDSDDLYVGKEATGGDGKLGFVRSDLFVNGGAHETSSVLTLVVKGNFHPLSVGDRLFVDDKGSSSDDYIYSITETNVDWTGSGNVKYQEIESLNFIGRVASNVISVLNTKDSINTRIDTYSLDDVIRIYSIGANANITCGTGNGDDLIEMFGGGNGAFCWYLTGFGDDTVTVVSNAINDRILMDGSHQSDTFNIRGTAAGSLVEVLGGNNSDTINISSLAPVITGNLDRVLGSVCVEGGSHDAGTTTLTIKGLGNSLDSGDILNIGDSGAEVSRTYTIDTGTVSRTGSETILYETIETLTVTGGEADNTINVINTAPAINTTITSGKGIDDLNIMTLGDGANVTINSGRNGDDIDVNGTGTGAFFELSGDIWHDTITVHANGISSRTRIIGGQGVDTIDILATATDSVVEVIGGSDGDTVNVGFNGFASSSIEGTVCASGENPTVNPGDTLIVDGNGAASFTDDGSTINVPGFAPVEYDTFENVGVLNNYIASTALAGTNLNLRVPGTNSWSFETEYTTDLNAVPQTWLPASILATFFIDGTNIIAISGIDPGQAYNFRLRYVQP